MQSGCTKSRQSKHSPNQVLRTRAMDWLIQDTSGRTHYFHLESEGPRALQPSVRLLTDDDKPRESHIGHHTVVRVFKATGCHTDVAELFISHLRSSLVPPFRSFPPGRCRDRRILISKYNVESLPPPFATCTTALAV